MQLPIQGGFDWYCIAFFMVSWYVANAGYAAAAYLRPATAMAALLCAVLAAGLLLSGAIAPSARAMYRTARPLYDLSGAPPAQIGASLGRCDSEIAMSCVIFLWRT